MNVSICLAPRAGLTYTWHGCLGLYDANHGDITESFDGGIKVKLVIDEHASTYEYMSSTLYFVKWGDRRYLVPEAKMMDLVNNYNQSGYARSGMFGIPRKEDTDKPQQRYSDDNEPDGKPQLPEKWAKLLLDKPVAFKVTAVRDRTSRTVTGDVLTCIAQIDLDKGSKDSVTVGMEIEYRVGWDSGTITIDKVDEHTCTGTFRTYGDKKKLLEPPPVGTVISSKVDNQIDATSEKLK